MDKCNKMVGPFISLKVFMNLWAGQRVGADPLRATETERSLYAALLGYKDRNSNFCPFMVGAGLGASTERKKKAGLQEVLFKKRKKGERCIQTRRSTPSGRESNVALATPSPSTELFIFHEKVLRFNPRI